MNKLKLYIIKNNELAFDSWINSLKNRIRICTPSNVLYVMNEVTHAEVDSLKDTHIEKIVELLSFYSTFDDILHKHILNRYIQKSGDSRVKVTLKVLSLNLKGKNNVFIDELIKAYLKRNSFTQPEHLTVC